MTNMLTGYCIISKGTRSALCQYPCFHSLLNSKPLVFYRITCTNLSGGRLSTVLSTRGGSDLKDNITLIFGLKSVTVFEQFVDTCVLFSSTLESFSVADIVRAEDYQAIGGDSG